MIFHDKTKEPQYGEDYWLTSNWEPNAEYSEKEYVNVYFRMQTVGFSAYGHFNEPCDRERFNIEVRKIFFDWDCKGRNMGSCSEITRGLEYLYLHPQDFSGWMKKSSVGSLARRLDEMGEYTQLQCVDLYDTAYLMPDEELLETLQSQQANIQLYLVTTCSTKRRTRFVRKSDVIAQAVRRWAPMRINTRDSFGCICDGYNSFDAVALHFMAENVDKLAEAGWIISARDGEYIRCANKAEQRTRHLRLDDFENPDNREGTLSRPLCILEKKGENA